MIARILLLSCMLLPLAACAPLTVQTPAGEAAVEPPAADAPEMPEPGPEAAAAPPEGRDEAASAAPAIVALLDEAGHHLNAGDGERAAAVLERALRIDARNALLWSRLADVRLRQARYDQAETMAMRSNGLARDDVLLLAHNWRLIAEARRLRGDAEGARQALERSRHYAGQGGR